MASRCQQSLQNQEEQVWLGGGHPQPLFWALLLQHQEGPPEPLQAQRSPQSLGRLALHRRGVHSGDSRTPGWDGGQILEELLPPAGRPASSGLHPEDPGRAALAPSLSFPMCRIAPRGQRGRRERSCPRWPPGRKHLQVRLCPRRQGARRAHAALHTHTHGLHRLHLASRFHEPLIPPLRIVAEALGGRSPRRVCSEPPHRVGSWPRGSVGGAPVSPSRATGPRPCD